MNLNYYYWYFAKALSEDNCNQIIKTANKKRKKTGITGYSAKKISKEQKNILKKQIRNSNVVWLTDKWIYDLIHPYINLANKNAGWNFQWDKSEPCQFTIYKKNQFYNWHSDSFPDPWKEGPFTGKIRKLSVTISLSDPEDYEGGELEFDTRNLTEGTGNNYFLCKEILPKGSIVVFPSHVYHRVRPVLKGTRLSLVIWNCGNPFV